MIHYLGLFSITGVFINTYVTITIIIIIITILVCFFL